MTEPSPPRATSPRDKIRSIHDLGVITETLKAAGETVVLAHGVFDLLHLGHVRHLEQAKSKGTRLIVTITADKFVNKGPGRPIFSEAFRAEMLGALSFVDYVGINHAPSAETVLDEIKPNIYVKGSDYENPEEDITGKISSERMTVEKHGGQLVFTRDITFSSSALINRYLDVYDPPLRDLLEQMRANDGLNRMLSLIERIKDYRVVLVGDAIIDEYSYVRPMGKAAKENILASRFDSREIFAGGVVAAANHLATFCREIEIITCLGEEDSYEELIRSSLRPNVKLTPLYRKNSPTTRKCRFVDPAYTRKLFEVYYFEDSPLEAELESELDRVIRDKVKNANVVIATDFGHGMITPHIIDVLCECSPFLAVNAQTNAGNQGYNLISKYHRADFICLDAPEARLAVADRFSDIADIIQRKLPEMVDVPRIIITHGQHGCITFNRATNEVTRIPAFTNQVVDTVGAGDAFFVVTAPLVCAGGDLDAAGFIGNSAGAIKVGIVGHRTSVEKIPLVKFLTAILK
ncbi:MAG: PfkB family carbohydrate kinase [Phaeospirillum sp.]|nr:PfkB family carbohydrate kinase [Phaeospirillum sp.]